MIQTASAPAASPPTTHPQCPVCATAATRFAFERNGDSIYACRACGLEFQFPQPDDQRLAAIYSSDYFLGSKDARSLQNQQALKRATARLYLDVLDPLITSSPRRILEVGCGHGDFLLEAQARGFAVEGLEFSPHAAAEANSRLGKDAVRVGSPEAGRLAPPNYDAVAAFDVIEHLRDPKRSLHSIHAALKPGGVIAIATPSLDSWSRRLLGRYWMEYKTEHLTYFGRKSLRTLLLLTGFTGVQLLPNYKTLNLEYVAAHFERFPVPVATPLVRLLRRLLPDRLVRKPVNVVASGVMAIARKPAAD